MLPLHHVHGIVNVTCCALFSGARLDLPPSFDALDAWRRISGGELTLFMAVPTVYAKLVAAWKAAEPAQQVAWSEGARTLRLMVSGSAALPVTILEEWERISGHRLLERYGMSETGMILSNPLHGERVAGSVGTPLPGVEVRFAGGGVPFTEEGAGPDAVCGEIEVRGDAVFERYWQRPQETEESFDHGWFKTGDMAVLERGRYRLLGRTSVDILKTGGYKVSALEIEDVLREHAAIAEVAVVGVDDEEWGERVAAAVVTDGGATLTLDALRSWGKERLASYKVPTLLLTLDSLPRNALGKVTKPDVKKLFQRLTEE